MAHGVTASKETLFRFGEALARAGFTCYAVDLPDGASTGLSFTATTYPGLAEYLAQHPVPIAELPISAFVFYVQASATPMTAVSCLPLRERLPGNLPDPMVPPLKVVTS